MMAAHPRSRGENHGGLWCSSFGLGSSPLTRGKLAQAKSTAEAMRLIPAHAGKTMTSTAPSRAGPAHPRSRGENQ